MLTIDIRKLKETDIVAYNLLKASWLQKAIRRCEYDTALSVAKLYLDDGQEKGLYRKLLVFITEDIGLACPEAIFLIEGKQILEQVAILTLLPKNREVDRFLLGTRDHYEKLVSNHEIHNEVEALANILNFAEKYYNSKKKEDKQMLEEEIAKITQDTDFHKKLTKKTLDNYFFLTKHNSFGARTTLAFIVLLNLRRIMPSNTEIPVIKRTFKQKFIVDDYALDKHTSFGKLLKRGEDHWLNVGSIVNNEVTYPSQFLSTKKEKYPYVIE